MTTHRRDWDKYKKQSAEAQRKRRKENPEKYREISRKSERRRKFKKYGITEEDYYSLLSSQNYVCAICKQPNSNNRDFHVDHNHKTGQVRGVLCHHCNLLLGNAKDNVETLRKAIEYLCQSI